MMDLATTYLGLDLPHPLMPGASPLVDDLDTVRRLEDAGAAAIVMHSLFEEQIEEEEEGAWAAMDASAESFAEATSYFPHRDEFRLGPDQYLEQVRRIREAVAVPVIGSLNGTSAAGWLEYAALIEQAGAHALELNVYHVPTDPAEDGRAVEERAVEIVRTVRSSVALPLAVKLSPSYSALPHLARRLREAGADGLVLFNRLFQPGFDVEELDVVPELSLSTPADLSLRLRWLAILSGQVEASLAVSGGVHEALDAVKAVMAGADAVQMVSALLLRGPEHLARVRAELARWLEEHEYRSLAEMRGSLSLRTCPDPSAFQRGSYARILQSWHPD